MKIKRNIEDYLSNKVKISTHSLRLKLIDCGILDYKCYNCNIKEWNNLPAPLQLHHIDGNNQNNNLCNLKLLCANCHAQTDNYAGKKLKKKRPINKCKTCSKILKTHNSTKCNSCHRKVPVTISKKELEKLIWEMTITDISKLLKISRTTVDRWCEHYSIIKPHEKHWVKIKYKDFVKKSKMRKPSKPNTLCPKCKINLMWKRSKKCKFCYKNKVD